METNLKTAVEQYVQHQVEVGQKPSTIGTIKRSLDLLVADMGEDKDVAKILPVHVANFFSSEAATMQPSKGGMKPRAPASVLQIRRIVRSALVWWHAQGLIKTLPLPASEKAFLEGKKAKKVAKAVDATEDCPQPSEPEEEHMDPATAAFEAMGESLAAALHPTDD